jgi:uncharacterized protein (UPF0335 family)
MSKSNGGPIASQELLLGIERIERLQEEKRGIADDIKDVYAEYKSRGFDTKAMREIIKLRKLTPEERREREAMLDTYKAALGMLDGTPLGRWAVEKLEKEDKPADDGGDPDGAVGEGAEEQPATPPEPEPDVDEAHTMGRDAARGGKPVTSNPFPARDIRRAAWDEAWCQELGSDGMDIPDALKPTPKPKKAKGAGEAQSGDGAGDEV